MGRKPKVKIAALKRAVEAGLSLSRIAERLKVSPAAIHKKLRVLRSQGLVRQISLSPALFEWITPEKQAQYTAVERKELMDGDDNLNQSEEPTKGNPNRVFEPHNCGERFRWYGGELKGGKIWVLPRSGVVCRKWKEKVFTIHAWSSGKLVIWLKRFKGLREREQVVAGQTMIRERALRFAREQGVRVRYWKPAGAREWNTTQVGQGSTSEFLKEAFGLSRETPVKQVGEVVLKADDLSHPDKVEVVSARPMENPKAADKFVNNLGECARGELKETLIAFMQSQKEFNGLVSETLAGIRKLKPLRPEERPELF